MSNYSDICVEFKSEDTEVDYHTLSGDAETKGVQIKGSKEALTGRIIET